MSKKHTSDFFYQGRAFLTFITFSESIEKENIF